MQRPFGEDELAALVAADLAPVVVLDEEGRVLSSTPSAAPWLDADGELTFVNGDGEPCSEPHLPHHRARVGAVRIDDLGVLRADGLVTPIMLRSAPVPGTCRTVHVLHPANPLDAHWQHLALQASRIGTWRWHVRQDRLIGSEQTLRLFGLEPSSGAPALSAILERIHEDDRLRVQDRVEAALRGPERYYVIEHRIAVSDGTVRWVESRGQVQRDRNGAPIHLVGTIQDITERKHLEEVARASEARLAALLHHTPDVALQGYDLDGRVLFWNPASERLFGWSASDAVGRTLDGLIHTPEEAAVFRQTLRSVHETGQATAPTEYSFKRRNGEIGWCLSTVFQISGPDEPPALVCMDVDRTESKRLQERMVQSERLESLGRLAGGVAHDFNNLLTSILGFTDLALDMAKQDDVAEHLRRVHSAAQRGAALTQQLLAYARRQVIHPRRVDVDLLVRQMAELLPRVLHDDVQLELRLAGDLPAVRLDPVQFDQIVLNLAINASDAMPDGGLLVLTTRHLRIDPPEPADPDAPAGDWVMLEVADSGSGLSEDVKARIFEPFFTTKPMGRGTGLGLATCYGIAQQNGGTITVRSELGGGAVFRVYLPVADGPVEPVASPTVVDSAGGSETILLVDDDATILALGVAVLERLGYRVLAAAHGEEALAVARAHPERIDLLLSDVVMPHLGGPELATALLAERPHLRVLLTSGYADEVSREALAKDFAFLQKPYTPSALTARVREVLAER